jgi:hypothetical protein
MGSTQQRGRRLRDEKAASLRILVLALATFAVGTGTFIVTGLLGGVARDLSVSVGSAGHLITVFAAIAVGTLLPRVKGAPPAAGGLTSRLAVARRPAVLATLLVTVLAMVSGFTVLTYVRPMLEGLTGFGGEGIGSMLLLFGLAAIAGSVLGGYGADRWATPGDRRSGAHCPGARVAPVLAAASGRGHRLRFRDNRGGGGLGGLGRGGLRADPAPTVSLDRGGPRGAERGTLPQLLGRLCWAGVGGGLRFVGAGILFAGGLEIRGRRVGGRGLGRVGPQHHACSHQEGDRTRGTCEAYRGGGVLLGGSP